MKTIEFYGYWGDQKKKVHICAPTGGEGVQIIIDNFYHGIILNRAGQWVGYLNGNSELTADDIQILGTIVAEAFDF
jgi:hypothetical protein